MKTILIWAGIVCAACMASADVLYWCLGDVKVDGKTDENYAFVSVCDASGKTPYSSDPYYDAALLTDKTRMEGANFFAKEAVLGTDTALYLGNDYSTHSFWVELYDSAGWLYARSQTVNFADVSAAIWKNDESTPTKLVVSSFTAVPEPTGGVLFGLGLALLGLRRRKSI